MDIAAGVVEARENEGFTTTVNPVPDRLTVWGDPITLSATLIAAVRDPTAVGVKVTVIMQDAEALTEVPQVFVWE